MIDITREEIWENRDVQIEKNKNGKLKKFILNHKILTALITALGILITTNTILICNFLKILTNI